MGLILIVRKRVVILERCYLPTFVLKNVGLRKIKFRINPRRSVWEAPNMFK